MNNRDNDIKKANKACLSGVPFSSYNEYSTGRVIVYATNPTIQQFHNKFVVSRFNRL